MSEWYEEYKEKVSSAIRDERLQLALERATARFSMARKEAVASLPYIQWLRKRAREVKAWSIENLTQLISILKERAEELGCSFHLSEDSEELRKYVIKVCSEHEAQLIIKSKSMVTEEVDLNEALEREGFRVVETDLGEFIVQLRGERATHMVVPAIHVPKEEVAALFSKATGRRVSPNVEALALTARQLLRREFMSADVGITGANVIAAETGTIVILENEGNARFVSNVPPVHVCVAGIEKVVPTIDDAMAIVQLLPPNATGQLMACYVSLITGPSRTALLKPLLST